MCQLRMKPLQSGAREEELFKQLNLDLPHLEEAEKQQLQSLLMTYFDTFALDSNELGTTDVVTHSIDTGDHRPVRQQPQCIPFALRATVDQLSRDMLEQKVIEPSSSPWASPIILVQKKDGGYDFASITIDLIA